MPSRRIVMMAVVALLVAIVQPDAAAHQSSDVTRGLVYAGLRKATGGACAGGFYLVRLPDVCTHGPDAAPAGIDVRRPDTAPRRTASVSALDAAVVCDGDGQSGNRVQLMYLHPSGTDRFAALLSKFRTVAAEVDDMYNKSAQETGGTRHVRYVTDASCLVSVLNVQLSATSLATFGDTVSALRALGYDRTDCKYLLFVESTVYCGQGSIDNDSSASPGNLNNKGPDYARVDQGCWDNSLATEVAAHELGHNLGAVQLDAPHTTTRFHCTDEYDRMCGSDGPDHPPVIVCTDPSHDLRFDCNHDDYYSTNPAPGGYLAGHWNVANSSFLLRGGPSAVLTGHWGAAGGTGVGVAESYGGIEWEMSLRDQLSTGPPSYPPYRYGNSACVPVTGDFDGIGGATVGVVCKRTGSAEWWWSLRDSLSSGTPTIATFNYGNNACTPVTGDWNGDGSATIGVACKGDLLWEWSLRDALSGGTPSYPPFRFGNSS